MGHAVIRICHINNHVGCIFCVIIGDYQVNEGTASKRVAGTIPSELGNLKFWKYVIFREYRSIYLSIWFVTI